MPKFFHTYAGLFVFLGIAIWIMGTMFRIMHWPAAKIIQFSGIGIIVLFGGIYVFYREKRK